MRLPAPLAGIEGGVHGDTQYDGAQPVSCRSQVDPVGDLALVCEHYEATVEAVGRSSRAGTLLGGDLMSASLDWVAALQVGPLAAIEAGLAREGWGVLLGDDSGRPVAASATGLRILGRSESEYMAMPMVMSALAPTTLRGLAGRRRRRAAGVPVPDVVEMEVVGADGGSCLCTAFIAHVDDAARGTLMVVVLRPQRPSLEIRDALKRTGPLFDAIGIGVVMWTFDAEDALRLVDVNDRAGAILGRDIRAKCGDLLDEIFPESHSFEAAARTLKSMARGSSHRLADVDGARFGDAHPARFRRLVVNLGGGLVAVLFVDVIEAVSAEMRERALLGELLADDDARRRMIADDLHDEQVQQLTVAAYELDAAARSEPNSATLLAAADQIRDAIEGLRQTMFGLNPPLPDATPLAEQISSAAQFIFAGTGVQVATAFDQVPDGTSDVQAGLARIANEAMLNVRDVDPSVVVGSGRVGL